MDTKQALIIAGGLIVGFAALGDLTPRAHSQQAVIQLAPPASHYYVGRPAAVATAPIGAHVLPGSQRQFYGAPALGSSYHMMEQRQCAIVRTVWGLRKLC